VVEGRGSTQTEPVAVREVDPDAVRATLAAIRDSGVLGKSARRAALLDYLVERELAGEGASLKAFTIAMDVFGRDEEFDPATDSIVRTEIGRLREALALFAAQTDDPALPRIEIPKGTYRPVIAMPPRPAAVAPLRPSWNRSWLTVPAAALALCVLTLGFFWTLMPGPERPFARSSAALPGRGVAEAPYNVLRIALLPFEGEGDDARAARLAFGLYSELERDLSAYPWLAVVTPIGPATEFDADIADYVLQGRILWEGDTLRASAELVSSRTHQLAWSKARTFRGTVAEIEETERLLTRGIVETLASMHGIAPDLARKLNAETSDANLGAFLCFLGMYQYLWAPSDALHAELRSCLSEVVDAYPRYGDAWAALALIYIDEARFGRNSRPGVSAWDEAGRAVEEALTFAPLGMMTLNAALIYSIETPDRGLDEFDRHADRLLELFPHHPATLANVGSRMVEFEARWEEGLELVEAAIAFEPDPPSWFYVAPALRAVLYEDRVRAVHAADRLTTQGSGIERILDYIAASRNAMAERMQAQRGLLAQIGLVTDADIADFVRARRFHPEIEEGLLDRLDRAFAMERGQ